MESVWLCRVCHLQPTDLKQTCKAYSTGERFRSSSTDRCNTDRGTSICDDETYSIEAHIEARTHTNNAHTHSCARTHTRARLRTHTHTESRAYTHTHARTDTHTQTQPNHFKPRAGQVWRGSYISHNTHTHTRNPIALNGLARVIHNTHTHALHTRHLMMITSRPHIHRNTPYTSVTPPPTQ